MACNMVELALTATAKTDKRILKDLLEEGGEYKKVLDRTATNIDKMSVLEDMNNKFFEFDKTRNSITLHSIPSTNDKYTIAMILSSL